MQNGFAKAMLQMVFFTLFFMLSLSTGNVFFLAVAMFAASRAFRETAPSIGYVCFLLSIGFLFMSVFAPLFNAMAGIGTYSFVNSPLGNI